MEILTLLNSIQPLSPGLAHHLAEILKEKQFKKKDHLLRERQISTNVYFIEEGLVRAFYINEKGEELTNWFMKEGDVIFSVASFLEQAPSHEYITALEDCSVYYISYVQLQAIYKEFPEFNYHGRVLTEKYYRLSLQRESFIKRTSSLERYQRLLEHEPYLLARAALQDIATYLGMSPEMLSKVRANSIPSK